MSRNRLICIIICISLFMGMLYFISSRNKVSKETNLQNSEIKTEKALNTQTIHKEKQEETKENTVKTAKNIEEQAKEKKEETLKTVSQQIETNKMDEEKTKKEEIKKVFEQEKAKMTQEEIKTKEEIQQVKEETKTETNKDNMEALAKGQNGSQISIEKAKKDNMEISTANIAANIEEKVSKAAEEASKKISRTAKEIENKIVGKDETQEKLLKEETRKKAVEKEIKEILTLHKIEFETGSAKLTPKGREIVIQIATILKKYPEFKIEIAGHTDSSGNAKFNQKLSQKRAETVKKALIKEGIEENRLVAKGYGATQPLVQREGEEKIQENRRVEFHILDSNNQ